MHDGQATSRSLDGDDSSEMPLVLAVESDEDNLLLLMSALDGFACRVLAAIDGKRALNLAKTYTPRLILTEIILPSLNGFELLDNLRLVPEMAAIPVIAVTVMASEDEKSRIFNAGFTDYLSKPYIIEDLHGLVRRYLT